MNRRDFIKSALGCAAAFGSGAPLPLALAQGAAAMSSAFPPNKLPRWRGFNLLQMFNAKTPYDFDEDEFAMIAGWGFDFVRIPASYLCWSSQADWNQMREEKLAQLDRAVALGRGHGVHVNLNLHRLPGYCVNPPAEPASLWTDPAALDAAVHQWKGLAQRFKGVPSSALSFDLINEPGELPVEQYVKVVLALVGAIRAEDADRLIIADGLKWGNEPVKELASLKIGQSTHGYRPMRFSHFKASWIEGSDTWPVPTWPLVEKDGTQDRGWLSAGQQPWRDLQAMGVGVHVGEWGAFNRTPHEAVMKWMRDCLELWKANGWGWALWNLTGEFGVLDSERKDVSYDTFKGQRLDRQMLELLQAH